MAALDDFVEHRITTEIFTISRWMAERRILYEYPDHDSEAFGEYDESHIPVIQEGIIGELITFDYLHTQLNEQFGGLDEPWREVRGRLCLQNQIGAFDKGYDLTIRGKTIDVKTYHERKLTKESMERYNLFVNVNEVQNKKPADYYIQAFFTPVQNNTIVLAGCHKGLPKDIKRKGIDRNIRSDAYACLVRNLMPMTTLVDLLLGDQ